METRPVLMFATALGLLAGCALTGQQKAAVSQFSDSAVVLGDTTSSELRAMRDATVKMTLERLLLGGKSKDPNLGDQASLDRGFDLDRVETIAGATRALSAYGRSLAALVDDRQTAELRAASNEFVASLGRVPAARGQMSDAQLQAIGTAVQEVGGLWIESKRRQAITTIVRASRPAVDTLCELLARDFDPAAGWVVRQLQVIEDPLMAEATNRFYDGRTDDERKAAIGAFRLVHDSRMRRTEVLKRVSEGAAAMKQANGALARAVEDSAWSMQDIQDFAQKARSLQTAVKLVVAE